MLLVSKQAKDLALAIAGARAKYGEESSELDKARESLRQLIRWNLEWHTITQSKWRVNCSRRIARNNHHDSWAIREKYARCSGDWSDYYDPTHRAIWDAKHPRKASA